MADSLSLEDRVHALTDHYRRRVLLHAADLADMGLMMATTDPEALTVLGCRERNNLMP